MPCRLYIVISAVIFLTLPVIMPVEVVAGTGVKVYMPPYGGWATVESLPFSYNGSFVVYNDGHNDGVYIVRVAVDDQAAISWLNMSPSVFVLSPGESKRINFSIDVQGVTGTRNYIFMPTRLTQKVEPYMDPFAKYISPMDAFRFTLVAPEGPVVNDSYIGILVNFEGDTGRVNLAQSSIVADSNVVTEIDRAIRLNVPGQATTGEPVPVSVSIFEGLSKTGITLMVVSPDGILYPVEGDNFTFTREGKWGVLVLVGEEVLMGRPVSVTRPAVMLKVPDIELLFVSLALLLLMALVPVWLFKGNQIWRTREDPYYSIIYKAGIVKKYIDRFDKVRLKAALDMLRNEYDGLSSRGARGRKDEARYAIEELSTLSDLE